MSEDSPPYITHSADLTEQSDQQARLQAIVEQTHAAQHDLARKLRALSTELPDDPESPAFFEQLQALRKHFEDRSSFVFFVCDQLIERGVPPNSSNIQKLAKWGSSSDMSADVRDWWQVFARRQRGARPTMPAAARPLANQLFERLYELTLQMVEQPVKAFVDDMTTQLQDAQTREHALAEQLAGLRSTHERLRVQADALADDNARQGGELTAARAELDRQARAHAARLAEMEQAHAAQISRLAQERELEISRRDAQLAEERQARASQAREAAAAAQAQQEAHALVVQSMQASITRLERLVDDTRRDAAVQVDAARQDAREANKRTAASEAKLDEARSVERTLREQIIRLEVAGQQTAAQLQAANTAIQAADSTIEALRAELQQVAEREKTTALATKRSAASRAD